jgi:hypothetical protein
MSIQKIVKNIFSLLVIAGLSGCASWGAGGESETSQQNAVSSQQVITAADRATAASDRATAAAQRAEQAAQRAEAAATRSDESFRTGLRK